MGLSSLQVCMDTNDWLQALGHDQENGIDSSSPSEDIITCSRPLVERRLRPPHDQALKCPRCDSTHTKFCYYNNYSLSQPRYFCKACRRYWTKGGSLRNIPVGGGCRKNKKVAVKKSNDQLLTQNYPKFSSIPQTATTDLHLSFPNMETSNFTTSFNPNLMERNYNAMLENPRQVDFMESKFNPMLGNPRSHDFMGTNEMSVVSHGCTPPSFNDHCSPFGISVDRNNGALLNDTSQRFMLTFEGSDDSNAIEMKPNNKLLSLEWQDHGSSDVGRDSIGYLDCFGPWGASINDHGSSPTNPLL